MTILHHERALDKGHLLQRRTMGAGMVVEQAMVETMEGAAWTISLKH